MGEEAKSSASRWILIATGVVGLVAAVLAAATKYYELHKARTEAAVAEKTVREAADSKEAPRSTPPEVKTPTPSDKGTGGQKGGRGETPPDVKKNPDTPGAGTTGGLDWKKQFPVGKYLCNYSEGGKATTELRADGTFYRVRGGGVDPVSQGKFDFKDGTIIFRGGGEFAEVWHTNGKTVRLEHWYPASRYPSNPPKETGDVTRVE